MKKLHVFHGRCRIDVELLARSIEFSTTIYLSAEQASKIRENNLKDDLERFIETYCQRKSFKDFQVRPVRIIFSEKERSLVSGIYLLIRLNFPTQFNYETPGMHYDRSYRTLVEAFKDIRHEIFSRTGIPFINNSTSPRQRLGKGGESITSLKKERDRAQRELRDLKRLIEFGNRRSGSKDSKKTN